ncbi:MAG: hypothetical protein ACXAE3_07725 [Candidatus Kariarchaeaceae archaeon]
MTDKLPEFDLSNAKAFGNYNNVSTSFEDGLEKSIMELASQQKDLLMSDILSRFGNYSTVHKQVKRLVLDNKLVLHELTQNSILENNFKMQQLRLTDPDNTDWIDLSAQPCLTCPIFNECGLENPVSPATCQEFNQWLGEEIEILNDEDHIEY